MKKGLLVFLLSSFFFTTVFCQNTNFDFYGNAVVLENISVQDCDSIIKQGIVPAVIQQYINRHITQYDLEDWAVVLFLKKYVDEAFKNISDAGKVKILSALLIAQNINNGIATRNKRQILSLVSIDNKLMPEGIAISDEGGSRLILTAFKREPFKIRSIDIVFYKGKDLKLRAVPPKLVVNDYKQISRSFYNYSTQKKDTINFSYSPQYINYAFDFPLALSHVSYTKLPISPLFTTSFFAALTPKLNNCKNKEDSINFLMRFTQTVLKYEHKIIIYSPESALVNGNGDCSDYSMLLAFLLSYYFNDLDITFLNYDGIEHVRLGIYNANFDNKEKSFVEYKGKRYLLAELTAETVLGDIIFKGVQRYPDRIIE
jgi:hypothetical protein